MGKAIVFCPSTCWVSAKAGRWGPDYGLTGLRPESVPNDDLPQLRSL